MLECPRRYGISLDNGIAHEYSLLNSQLVDLDQALILCDERDRLEAETRQMASAMQSMLQAAEQQSRRQEMQIQQKIAMTRQFHEQAQSQSATRRKAAEECENRLRALEEGELSSADRSRIQMVENATRQTNPATIQRLQLWELKKLRAKDDRQTHVAIIQVLQHDLNACKSRLAALQQQVVTTETAWAVAESELAALIRDEISSIVQDAVIQVALLAGDEHAAKLANHERHRQALAASVDKLEKQIKAADQTLAAAQAKCRELAGFNEPNSPSRCNSLAWWEQQVEIASTQKARITQAHAEVVSVLQQTDLLLQQSDAARRAAIDRAIGEEFLHQKNQLWQVIEQLAVEHSDLRCQVVAEQTIQMELCTNIELEPMATELAREEAVAREKLRMLEEARKNADQAKTNATDAEAREQKAKENYEAAATEPARLLQERETARQRKVEEQAPRLAAIQQRMDEIHAIFQQMSTQNDLQLAAPFSRGGFVTGRESRLVGIQKLCGNRARDVFIVDTSVLVERPDVLNLFTRDELAVVSKRVIEELDGLKRDETRRIRVTQAIKLLSELARDKLQFCNADPSLLPRDYPPVGDNLILSVALKYRRYDPILLTNDNNLTLKAKAEDIATMRLEDFVRRVPGRRA